MSAVRRSDTSAALTAAVFAPMCGFAAAHWAGLLASPPVAEVVLVVAIATVLGIVLALSARLEPAHRALARLVRVSAVVVAALAALVAVGIPPDLLAPAGWGELVAGLDRGFGGVPQARWPYAGTSEWVRLTILLAIPLISVPAAAFALWPPAPGPGGPEAAAVRRGGALLLLLTLFGLAAAQHPLPDNAARGGALLLLLAAWLFLPRLSHARPAAALTGAGAVLAAGLAALPLAAAIAPERPLIEGGSGTREVAQGPKEPRQGGRSRVATDERRRVPRRVTGETRRSRDRAERTRRERGFRARSRRESSGGEGRNRGGGGGERQSRGGAPRGSGSANQAGPPILLFLLIAAAAAAAVRFLLLPRLRGRAARGPSAADAVAELRTALERLGWTLPPPVTLAELEPRLAAAAGPPAAGYARRLREWRFSAHPAAAPSRLERRELRRSLTAGHGPIGRARGLWALPPARLTALARPGRMSE